MADIIITIDEKNMAAMVNAMEGFGKTNHLYPTDLTMTSDEAIKLAKQVCIDRLHNIMLTYRQAELRQTVDTQAKTEMTVITELVALQDAEPIVVIVQPEPEPIPDPPIEPPLETPI